MFFSGATFSPPHPLLSTGQSLNSSWRQTHHRAIPRKGDQDLQLGPVKKLGKGISKMVAYLIKKDPYGFYDLLCFLEINHQTKVCKS